MQRVLSIQTARGFGESSEFVTKRSCISFLFAIGFLSLLGGFMLGRFAVHRTIMARAERAKLEMAQNGLVVSEHLQYYVLDSIQNANFLHDPGNSPEKGKSIFSEFPFIKQVFRLKSCSVGRVQGSKEPDRYVMVSLMSKESGVLKELMKSLNKINTDQDWNPRRSILFSVCEESCNECFYEMSHYLQSKVVAFITQADNYAKNFNLSPAEECLLLSGSNIAETAVRNAVDFLKNLDSKFAKFCHQQPFISNQFNLDIPHAVLSFLGPKKNNSVEDNFYVKSRKIVTQVIALSVWRLSESIILPWSQNNLNETINRSLKNVGSSNPFEGKESEKLDLNRVVEKITSYVENINSLETTNVLNVRIANDLLLDLDKTFICLENRPRFQECFENLIEISSQI